MSPRRNRNKQRTSFIADDEHFNVTDNSRTTCQGIVCQRGDESSWNYLNIGHQGMHQEPMNNGRCKYQRNNEAHLNDPHSRLQRRNEIHFNKPTRNEGNFNNPDFRLQRRNETHLNEPARNEANYNESGSRLQRRNEANYNESDSRLQRRNEANYNESDSRVQRRNEANFNDQDSRLQRNETHLNEPARNAANYNEPDSRLKSRNEANFNDQDSRLQRRNETYFNEPETRIQRRNEALGNQENNRYQRRHTSRHDQNDRFQGRGEPSLNYQTSNYRRGYETSQNDRGNRYQREGKTFENYLGGRYQENDYFRSGQEGRYQGRRFAFQTGRGSKYQRNDTLQRDLTARYLGKNDAFLSDQNARYEGENGASRNEHNMLERRCHSFRRDKNSRYQERYQASQSEHNIKYEIHGSPRRYQNNRQEKKTGTSQSDQTVRNQGRYKFFQSNQIGRYQTQEVSQNEMNITHERKNEESQNNLYCRYQKVNETSERNLDGRYTKDKESRFDQSDRYQKRNEALQNHLKIVDQAQEMVKYNQNISELLQTEIEDNKRTFPHRCPTEYPDKNNGVLITDQLRPTPKRIVSTKIVKMVSHTETVKKHQRGTISPPQKRYPNWNTPRAVKAKGVRITGARSAVVRYSSAERLPEEKSENKPRRQTWSLQFEIDSQIKSSTETNTRIVEKSYRKGTIPEMTRFPNRRSTIPVAHPIQLMVGHGSEAVSQQTNFTYKRSREQETHDIQFPNKCTRTSTTMSSRTQEVEREVRQRGSLISDSFSPKYRSNSACYRDRQSKIGYQQVGPSVHHKACITSKQLKGSMQNAGSIMEKVPKDMAFYNEEHKSTNSGSSSTSHTWFIKKFLRGLGNPKEIDTDRCSRIPVPTNLNVFEQKINRDVPDVGCRQQQIALSKDPRLRAYNIRNPRDSQKLPYSLGQQPGVSASHNKDTECRMRTTQAQSEPKDVQIGYRELESQQERVGNVRTSAVLPPPERPVEYCRREHPPPNAGILERILQESRSRNFRNNRRQMDAVRPQRKYYNYCCMYTNDSP